MDTTMLSERWHLRLKIVILYRNAKSRADCLVEYLTRVDRRRLASASFRVQQTTVRYRSALKYLAKNP
ncbi:hypothetical protein Q1695_009045 [Nippostrongylus brasiliensis]|nr:hypothetical protein Q1695_009045 [Nippostrongylus brasiliensis]